MDELTITLNISTEVFINWLEDYTADVYLDFFPMSKGGVTLQPVKGPISANDTSSEAEISPASTVMKMTIDAFYWDGEIPRSGSVHPWHEAISFKIINLAAERIEVSIRCQYPAIKNYYNDLLVAMLMRWPESQAQLAHLDMTEIESPSETKALWQWLLDDDHYPT
jgi:hypothetical protein